MDCWSVPARPGGVLIDNDLAHFLHFFLTWALGAGQEQCESGQKKESAESHHWAAWVGALMSFTNIRSNLSLSKSSWISTGPRAIWGLSSSPQVNVFP